MVTVVEPVAAVAVAEKETVIVQVGLHGLFVKATVTPVGRPEAEKVTGVIAPWTRVAVIDEIGLVPPWATVRLPGEGEERLKSKPGAETVSDSVVEWLAPPPLALIVTVLVPIVALAVAEKVTVTVQVGLHGLLVNVAVTPVGRPDTENVTGVVVPLTKVAVIDEAGLVEPWTTRRPPGDGAPRLKSNLGAATVNDMLVEWLAPPPEAAILTAVVPKVAVAIAKKDTVTVQVGLQGLLVNVAVTPLGNPEAENVTTVVVPLTRVAVIEEERLVPP